MDLTAHHGFLIRIAITAVVALLTAYYVQHNWKWYNDEFPDEVKQPSWANPTVNIILWIVWFSLIALTWHRHTLTHKDAVRMDLFYVILLLLSFLTIVLFFSMHDYSAASWFGIALAIASAYLVYEGFMADQVVAWTQVVVLGITLYTVAQLWYFRKNLILDSQQV